MKKQTIIAAACLSLIPILMLDRITPLEYVEWVLYIIPTIVVALAAGRKASVLFTGFCSGLMMFGFYLSPPSILPLRVAIYNRAIGIITLWSAMLLMRLYSKARVEISKLVQAQEELKREKDLLQNVMNAAGNSHLVYLDRDFNFVRVNETYAKTCGYKPEEMVGKNHFDLYPHAENEAIFARVRDTGVAEEYHDKPFVFPDQPERGTTYWDWTLTPVKDRDGTVLGLVFSLIETTERKRAEELASHLASFPQLNPNPILEVDTTGKVVYRNLAAATTLRQLGRDEDDNSILLPPDLYELLKDLDTKGGTSVYREITAGNKVFEGDIHFLSRLGVIRLYIRDITERKRAEEALRQSESNLARAQAIAHLGDWEVDIGTNVVRGSQELYRLFELTPAIALDAYIEKFHPEDKQRVIDAINASIHEGKHYTIDYRIVLSSGETRHVHAEGETIRDSSGAPIKFFGTFQDITERKQAEEALQRTNAALEASNKELDAFVYSVSHDLRGPLRRIIGFTEILLEEYSGRLDDEGNRHLSSVIKGAAKMNEIIEGLLRLSRISRNDVRLQNVDISEIAGSIVAELRGTHPDRSVDVHVKEALMAYADPGLVEIALFNLLGNAWKFTSKTDNARIELGSFEREGKTVYYVRDNGAGFDQEFAKRLFEPFNRLHSEQDFEGTGIGLAIVERVIRRHGGKIWTEGKKNEGTVFYFTLN